MQFWPIFLTLLICVCTTLHTHGAPMEHKITKFPGFDGELPSNMYSGYIPVAEGKMFYNYIFTEAFNNPETAPIALWMQGGPGGSGMLGFFTEIGPFTLNQTSYTFSDDETNKQTIKTFINPYTWAQNVNYIFFESPAPTGYSYCEDECPLWNDEMAAKYNYEFITKFFELYPEHKSKEFYLTGESYAGIYVPTLANEIMENENDINFAGVMIGNCCMGKESKGGCSKYEFQFLIDFYYQHGQISTKLYNEIIANCPPDDFSSPTCQGYIDKVMTAVGSHDEYNYYNECPAFEKAYANPTTPNINTTCYREMALFDYMNMEESKQFFNTNKSWEMIVSNRSFYVRTENETFPYYKKMMDRGLKIMVYFGDVDTNVPYNGGYNWVKEHFTTKTLWRPWTVPTPNMRPWYPIPNNLVAGYIETFEGNMKFVTVRGSGHMVPKDKPETSLVMFENFIFDRPFNTYAS